MVPDCDLGRGRRDSRRTPARTAARYAGWRLHTFGRAVQFRHRRSAASYRCRRPTPGRRSSRVGSFGYSAVKNAVGSIAKSGWLVLPILTVMAFIAVEVRRVAPTITISNLDYFPLLERATRLSFHSLDAWVDQVHPVGYPWLIRLGLMSGWDAERVGQALSIAGGVLGLLGAWLIAKSVLQDKRFVAIALAFVATTSLFLYFGSV